MGLFSKKQQTPAADSTLDVPRTGSGETTAAPSHAPSIVDEKQADTHDATAVSTNGSRSESHDHAGDDLNPAEKKAEAISNDEEQEEEDNTEYPKSVQLALITVALCLSVFCMAIDNTIISTAIPRITDEFDSIGSLP